MEKLLILAFTAFLVENVVLYNAFGICPFLGVSKKTSNAVGMGLAVTFIIVIATNITWVLYNYILIPLEMIYLQTLVFILVIASLVQVIELFVKKVSPSLYNALGVYLPLITTNCAVLGCANAAVDYSFIEMNVFALFSGLGFLFVMWLFSGLREKIETAPVPKGFKGFPIALIAASAIALIFLRLGGIL